VTGSVIGQVACAEREDLNRAVVAAQKGFEAWRDVPAASRFKLMQKAAELLRSRAESIARLLTQEQGKPLAEAKGEVMVGADNIDWFADEGMRVYGRVVPSRTSL
jgi:succinate-semialdehyde dehydrogenase/glutarate-semialdehyde dehydrogenase